MWHKFYLDQNFIVKTEINTFNRRQIIRKIQNFLFIRKIQVHIWFWIIRGFFFSPKNCLFWFVHCRLVEIYLREIVRILVACANSSGFYIISWFWQNFIVNPSYRTFQKARHWISLACWRRLRLTGDRFFLNELVFWSK